MKNFKSGGPKFGGNKFGGGGGFGGNRGGFKPRFDSRGGGDRPMQMHQATCAECQKSCEVPFRPNGEKPVYCRDCFASKGGGSDRDFSPRPARPSFGDRKPYAPRQDFRPREEGGARGGADVGELKSELKAISQKLDRLIDAMSAKAPKAEAKAEKAEKPAKAEKKPAKKAVAKKK